MSGINDVLKGYGCVLKKRVRRSQPRFVLCVCMCVCMCVFLFPDSVLSSLQKKLEMQHAALLFCPCALKRIGNGLKWK